MLTTAPWSPLPVAALLAECVLGAGDRQAGRANLGDQAGGFVQHGFVEVTVPARVVPTVAAEPLTVVMEVVVAAVTAGCPALGVSPGLS